MDTKIVKKSNFKPASLLGLLVLATMLLAACSSAAPSSNTPGAYGGGYGSSGSANTPASMPTAAGTASSNQPSASSEATINVATDPNLGQILVDGKGMTLYVFDKDTADKSNCNATCLALWPPLLTQGHPTLGPGVNQSLIGTTMTTDGRMMVTYNHKPLYYFASDTKPGDTNGQGVGNFFVIGPDGTEITK